MMSGDPYARIRREELYRNPWLAVERHEIVHPNGLRGEHLLIVVPPACATVVEDRDALIFARQPRFGARAHVIEIVKGGREDGEAALACAQRELREELGVTAARWVELGRLYEIPSIVSQPVALFLASDIAIDSADPEPQESIELVRLTIDAALKGAANGQIDDAVTVAALFRYAAVRGLISGGASPAEAAPLPGSRDPRVRGRRY